MNNLQKGIDTSLFDSYSNFTAKDSFVTHNISNVIPKYEKVFKYDQQPSSQKFNHRELSHRKSNAPDRSPVNKSTLEYERY